MPKTRFRLPSGRRLVIAITALATAFTVGRLFHPSMSAEAQTASPTMLTPDLGVRAVVSGLATPTTIAFLGSNDFLVLEKNTGRVQRVTNGVLQGAVLDLAVNSAVERGLLGIALDPAFATNNFVYLYWTCAAPVPSDPFTPSLMACSDPPQTGADTTDILGVPLLGNRVDRFVWNGSTLAFDRNLIKLHAFQNDAAPIPPNQNDQNQPPAGNHNAGIVTFGPDGKLYFVIGDNGRRGQLQNLPSGPTPTGLGPTVQDDQFGGPAPDNNHFTGVIFRLNPDGTTPTDNPFFAAGAAIGGETGANIQKIFGYGLRNSFGMAFDPLSGELWTQENGDDSFDEINHVQAAFNGGWIQTIGPLARISEFKAIETGLAPSTLQQLRWPPVNIADTPQEALARLFMLPGAHFTEPEFSWRYAIAPAAIGFVNTQALGTDFFGSLLVGCATPAPLGGALFRFKFTPDRQHLMFDDPRLSDGVADNRFKRDLTESESLLVGQEFGVVTDIKTAPNGNVYVVSNTKGAVYEIFDRQPAVCATDVSASVSVTRSGFRFNMVSHRFEQVISLRNSSASPIGGAVTLVVDNLSPNATLFNKIGNTACTMPPGTPFVAVDAGADSVLAPGETSTVVLEFANPSQQGITYSTRVLAGGGNR
jgi:glucose/arabinose dehydrogenase